MHFRNIQPLYRSNPRPRTSTSCRWAYYMRLFRFCLLWRYPVHLFSRLCFCPPFFSVIHFFEEFLENFDQEGEKRGFFYFLFFLFSLLFPCLVSHYTDTHLHVLFLDLFLSEDHHYSIHEYSWPFSTTDLTWTPWVLWLERIGRVSRPTTKTSHSHK